MWPTITDFDTFYSTPLGKVVRADLRKTIHHHWHNTKGQTVLGLGHTSYFLKPFTEKNTVISLNFHHQGIMPFAPPPHHKNLSAQTADHALPLMSSEVDKILLVHGLENSLYMHDLLTESWRVLKGDGRILLAVPSRISMWSHSANTPLAYGKPFTLFQLKKLMQSHGFTPIWHQRLLQFPPFRQKWIVSLNKPMAKIIGGIMPSSGGLILMECKKEVYARIPPGGGTKSPVTSRFRPILKPASVTPNTTPKTGKIF